MTAASKAGRVALITGCAKRDGIGAESARWLSRTGMAVVLVDVAVTGAPDRDPRDVLPDDWHGVESLAAEIDASGGTVTVALGDVGSEADVKDIVETALDRHGRLDVLLNNAAAPFSVARTDVAEISAADWDLVMAINLKGPFLLSREAAHPMRAQRYGRIINISSSAGLIGNRHNSAYSTSKAGILGLTKALAMDLGPWGITVNAIAPGAILTSRVRSAARLATGGDEEAGLGAMMSHNPIGRLGTPEDIAAAVTFLASEEAEYVSGQTLSVDGGMTRV